MKLLTLQFKSLGEIEAIINTEIYRLNLVSYHPSHGRSVVPALPQAQEEMQHSYGYLCAFEDAAARAWLVRVDKAYYIYVSKELSPEFIRSLQVASFDAIRGEIVAAGWTKLVVDDEPSLMLATGAVRRWMFTGSPGVPADPVSYWRD